MATNFGPEETPEEVEACKAKKVVTQQMIKDVLATQIEEKQRNMKDLKERSIELAKLEHEEGKNILLSLRKINNVNKDMANQLFKNQAVRAVGFKGKLPYKNDVITKAQ